MGLEMTATRFVAPYFGSSTLVWTNVIAVIMIALALGYWSGGKLAEKKAPLSALQRRLLLSAALMALAPFLVSFLTDGFLLQLFQVFSGSIAVLIGSFFLVVFLFFLPTYLLAMTSPYLVGYETRKGSDAGKIAGRIFAIGTIGSILGTFLGPLVLVPMLGSKRTMLLFAGILFLLTAPVLIKGKRGAKVLLVLPFLWLFSTSPNMRSFGNLIVQAESPYQYIQVLDENGTRLLVTNEGGSTQSMYNSDHIVTGNNYFEVAALTPALFGPDKPLNILVLGLGGGTVSREIDLLYPDRDLSITGVEIDPNVIALAKRYFDLDRARLNVVNMDGRSFLRTTHATYDMVVIDAFSNQYYLPPHMVTQEFFESVQDHLTPLGVVVSNFDARLRSSPLLTTFTNTLASVFPAVYRVAIPDTRNDVLIARMQPFAPVYEHVPQELLQIFSLVEGSFEHITYSSGQNVFTDDWAPTEMMMDRAVWQSHNEITRAE